MNIQMTYRFKMAAKIRIFISRMKSLDQHMKNHFPEGIFLNKLADHEYIHIAEIKFKKRNVSFAGAKIVCHTPQKC